MDKILPAGMTIMPYNGRTYLYPINLISHPYLVYKNSPFATLPSVKAALNKANNSLLDVEGNIAKSQAESFLQKQIDIERAKEADFINNFCKNVDPEVGSLVKSCLDQGKYSTAITILDAYHKGIITELKQAKKLNQTVRQTVAEIKEYYNEYSYNEVKKFVEEYEKTLDDHVLNYNLEQLFADFSSYISKHLTTKKANWLKGKIQYYQKTVDYIKKEMEKLPRRKELKSGTYQQNIGEILDEQRKQIRQFEKEQEKKGLLVEKMELGKVSTEVRQKTIGEYFISLLKGTFLGSVNEVVVGGAKGGNQVKTVARGDNAEDSLKLNPDTDNRVLWSVTGKINQKMPQLIERLEEKTVYEDVENELQQIYQEYGTDDPFYTIYYSVKSATEKAPKLKGAAQYLTRIEDIKQVFRQAGLNEISDVVTFLFINTLSDLVAEDKIENIERMLLQVASVFVFDDIIPDLVNDIKTDNSNKKLKFLIINGQILTASEVLMNLQRAAMKKDRSIINLHIKQKAAPTYVKGTSGTLEGWNSLYEKAAANQLDIINLSARDLNAILFNGL